MASGIDLAYEYKLPKPVIAFIPQHHGTALMSYFYARAKELAVEQSGLAPNSPGAREVEAAVDERRFRHAGPKPQSREAAILILLVPMSIAAGMTAFGLLALLAARGVL